MSRVGPIRLLDESIISVVNSPLHDREGGRVFISLVAVSNGVVTDQIKKLKVNTFRFGQTLIIFSEFHLNNKVRMQWGNISKRVLGYIVFLL